MYKHSVWLSRLNVKMLTRWQEVGSKKMTATIIVFTTGLAKHHQDF